MGRIDGESVNEDVRKAFSHLRAEIRAGRIAAGRRILDAAIAEELDVGRVASREALRLLEDIGMVTISRRIHYRVRPEEPALMRKAVECLGAECGIVVQLALPRMDVPARAAAASLLREAASACETAPISREEVYRRSHLAFAFLANATGNRFVREAFAHGWQAVRRAARGEHELLQPIPVIAARLHEAAHEVENGDPTMAEASIRRLFHVGVRQSVS